MKLTRFRFFFLFRRLAPLFVCFIPPASGRPLHTDPHESVAAVVGRDVILPCRLTTSAKLSRAMAVEWSRVDGPSPLTVHVDRNGEELVKEKAPEYLRRTAIMEGGSLKLHGVQWRDTGTYRCVLSRSSVENEVFVSLIVAEVSEVNLSVRRTSANELFVHCESSGWRPEPTVSLLDSRRNVLDSQNESTVRPDDLYSVRASVKVPAAEAKLIWNWTLICRVEIPGTSLGNESKIYITDEFDPPKAGLDCRYVWVGAFLLCAALCCVIAAVVAFAVPVPWIEKLRSSLKVFHIGWISRGRGGQQEGLLRPEVNTQYTEYGDVLEVDTSGASEHTAKADHLLSSGIQASEELAKNDLEAMLKYKDKIIRVGNKLHIHPALIAGIISKQSRAGTKLNPKGFGSTDQNCFGLMQINKHYHAVKGDPFSEDHVDQGVTFFIQLIKTMSRMKRDWTKEQQLKGALACYIAGEDRVIPLTYDELDSVTPYKDFANDVIARAKWYANTKWFACNDSSVPPPAFGI